LVCKIDKIRELKKKEKMMRNLVLSILVLLLIVTVVQAKVKLVEAKIDPAAAGPGETVNVTVEFSGKAKNVSKVLMVPREYAYEIDQPFYLQADSSGANIWRLEGPVPYEAPMGEVNLEIKAYDAKDNEIVIKEFEEQTHGKAGLIKFEIK